MGWKRGKSIERVVDELDAQFKAWDTNSKEKASKLGGGKGKVERPKTELSKAVNSKKTPSESKPRPSSDACPECGGTGEVEQSDPGWGYVKCHACNGTGKRSAPAGGYLSSRLNVDNLIEWATELSNEAVSKNVRTKAGIKSLARLIFQGMLSSEIDAVSEAALQMVVDNRARKIASERDAQTLVDDLAKKKSARMQRDAKRNQMHGHKKGRDRASGEAACRYRKPNSLYPGIAGMASVFAAILVDLRILWATAAIIAGYAAWYCICYFKIREYAGKSSRFQIDVQDGVSRKIRDQAGIARVLTAKEDEDKAAIAEIYDRVADFEKSASNNSGKIVFTADFVTRCLATLFMASDKSKARIVAYGKSIMTYINADPAITIQLQRSFLAALQVALNEHVTYMRRQQDSIADSMARFSPRFF